MKPYLLIITVVLIMFLSGCATLADKLDALNQIDTAINLMR